MNPRAAVALLLVAGLPVAAAAQETITYSWTWSEVVANTSTPVANPNGIVEPGEGARLALTVTISPGIGTPATYQSPPWPPPGNGTIAGLGTIFFDLLGTNAGGGQWTLLHRNSAGVNWALGSPGTSQPNGDIISAGAGQFVLQGANSTNPVVNIWRGTWTPADYAPRPVSFQSTPAAASMGNHSSIVIQYGYDPNTLDPLYVYRYVDGQFDGSGPIPIVPAPTGLAVLAALAPRRRRPSLPP